MEKIGLASSNEKSLDELFQYLEHYYSSADEYVFPSHEIQVFFEYLYATLEAYEYDIDEKPLMYGKLLRLQKVIEEGHWSVEDAIHATDYDRFSKLYLQYESNKISKETFREKFYLTFRFDFDKLIAIHEESRLLSE